MAQGWRHCAWSLRAVALGWRPSAMPLGWGRCAVAQRASCPQPCATTCPPGTPSPCEPNEFKCRNGHCALKLWRCDGENDCGDGSDEDDCRELGTGSGPAAGHGDAAPAVTRGGGTSAATKAPGAACGPAEFRCVASGSCIRASYQCDREPDCPDRSDEVGCGEWHRRGDTAGTWGPLLGWGMLRGGCRLCPGCGEDAVPWHRGWRHGHGTGLGMPWPGTGLGILVAPGGHCCDTELGKLCPGTPCHGTRLETLCHGIRLGTLC